MLCGRCKPTREKAGRRKSRGAVYSVNEACSLVCFRNGNYGLRGSSSSSLISVEPRPHHPSFSLQKRMGLQGIGEPPNRWGKVTHISPQGLPLWPLQPACLIFTISTVLYPVLFSTICPGRFSSLLDQHKCSYMQCSCLMGVSCPSN